MFIRQIAYKCWISDLVSGTFVKEQGEFDSNYIEIAGNKVSRVNLIGNVIMKYDNSEKRFSTLTIDDGSGAIKLKMWGDDVSFVENTNVGDIILIIGRVREYNSEIYLTPEIVKLISDPSWELVRRLELTRLYGEPRHIATEEKAIVVENNNGTLQEQLIIETESIGAESPRQKILSSIEKLAGESGADVVEVINSSKLDENEANIVLQELLLEGEIFEPKPGRLKLVA